MVTSTGIDLDIEDGPVDLSHLHDSAQQIARLPNEERLRYVRGRTGGSATPAPPPRWNAWRRCSRVHPSSGCRTCC